MVKTLWEKVTLEAISNIHKTQKKNWIEFYLLRVYAHFIVFVFVVPLLKTYSPKTIIIIIISKWKSICICLYMCGKHLLVSVYSPWLIISNRKKILAEFVLMCTHGMKYYRSMIQVRLEGPKLLHAKKKTVSIRWGETRIRDKGI